jgi:hypothetical protein
MNSKGEFEGFYFFQGLKIAFFAHFFAHFSSKECDLQDLKKNVKT